MPTTRQSLRKQRTRAPSTSSASSFAAALSESSDSDSDSSTARPQMRFASSSLQPLAGVSQQTLVANGEFSIENAVEQVQQQAQAIRPSATLAAYTAKQKEFEEWANRKLPGQANA